MAASVTSGFEPFFRDVSVNPNIIPMDDTAQDEKKRSKYVFIDSRDRNTVKHNSANKYEISFNEPFENVISVELISIKLPFPDINEPYIIMKVSGMNIIQSNNNIANQSTVIIYENPDSTNINFHDSVMKVFKPPISMNKFKVSFYKYNGELYDFTNLDHSIVLKITTLKQGRRL